MKRPQPLPHPEIGPLTGTPGPLPRGILELRMPLQQDGVLSEPPAPYRPADASRIDLSRIRDIYYWIAEFGCSAEQLRAAVAKAGDGAAAVQTTLALERAAYAPKPEKHSEDGDCLELFF